MARRKPLGKKTTYYTVPEAADMLDVGVSTLYRAIKRKQVPHHVDPIRGWVRFTDNDIREIEDMGARQPQAVRPQAA